MNAKSLEMFKGLLQRQLQELLKEASSTVGGMADEEKRETFPDPTDRAALETDRNFLLRIRDRERRLITKIKEALERIDQGEFGICESCGGEISQARLKARPVTTLCIRCKTEAEESEKPA
jgi:DnaK suppressor protein